MTPGLVWRYGQGRGLWYAAGIAGPLIVVACAIAPRTIPLLLGENDQRLRLPAVIALVVTIALGPSFARGLSDAEWLYRARLRIARTVHVVVSVLLVAAVAVAVAGTLSPNKLVSEVFLNGLGLLGICLITVMLTPLPPWVATLVIVGTTYVVGTDSDTGRPYIWAWLLWTDRSGLKAAINLVLFGAGVVLFLLRPGRVTDASD